MNILDLIFDEFFLAIGVLCICVVAIKIRNFLFGGSSHRQPPEAGTGYLSSFADDDTGFPPCVKKDEQERRNDRKQ